MYTVTIEPNDGDSFEVQLCDTKKQFKRLTIQDLFSEVTSQGSYRAGQFWLKFEGQRFDDEDDDDTLLTEVGIEDESVIYLIRKRKPPPLAGDISCGMGRTNSMDRLSDFDKCILM